MALNGIFSHLATLTPVFISDVLIAQDLQHT